MNKRRLVAALIAVLILITTPAFAVEPIVLFGGFGGGAVGTNAVFAPWGSGETCGSVWFATCFDGRGDNAFGVAYLKFESGLLEVGEKARFEVVTEGGSAPFVYEYDVYYQPFSKEARSYYGELHEVSFNSYLDFTPRKEGRYIVVIKVSDASGNEITFDSDAIPTNKDGELSKIVEAVAKEAASAGSEYEAVRFINDWLCENAEYSGTDSGKYEADSILLSGRGVCSGYASTFNILCSACGIESFSVHGYASAQPIGGKEHSWNCVKVEGDWYFVDVTANDNNKAFDSNEFFLMTSATCEQAYCFGKSAGAFGGCGGACLPPRCNATIYAEGYDNDQFATGIEITAAGVGAVGESVLVVGVGCELQLYGTTAPRASRHASKIWSSSDDSVARVDCMGVLYAVGVGRCTVEVICGEFADVIEVKVERGSNNG